MAAGISLSPQAHNHQREGIRRRRRARGDVLARSLVERYNADQRILRSKPAHPLGGSLAIRQRARNFGTPIATSGRCLTPAVHYLGHSRGARLSLLSDGGVLWIMISIREIWSATKRETSTCPGSSWGAVQALLARRTILATATRTAAIVIRASETSTI